MYQILCSLEDIHLSVGTVTLLFRYRLAASQTPKITDSQTDKHFSHLSFRSPEDPKGLQIF